MSGIIRRSAIISKDKDQGIMLHDFNLVNTAIGAGLELRSMTGSTTSISIDEMNRVDEYLYVDPRNGGVGFEGLHILGQQLGSRKINTLVNV